MAQFDILPFTAIDSSASVRQQPPSVTTTRFISPAVVKDTLAVSKPGVACGVKFGQEKSDDDKTAQKNKPGLIRQFFSGVWNWFVLKPFRLIKSSFLSFFGIFGMQIGNQRPGFRNASKPPGAIQKAPKTSEAINTFVERLLSLVPEAKFNKKLPQKTYDEVERMLYGICRKPSKISKKAFADQYKVLMNALIDSEEPTHHQAALLLIEYGIQCKYIVKHVVKNEAGEDEVREERTDALRRLVASPNLSPGFSGAIAGMLLRNSTELWVREAYQNSDPLMLDLYKLVLSDIERLEYSKERVAPDKKLNMVSQAFRLWLFSFPKKDKGDKDVKRYVEALALHSKYLTDLKVAIEQNKFGDKAFGPLTERIIITCHDILDGKSVKFLSDGVLLSDYGISEKDKKINLYLHPDKYEAIYLKGKLSKLSDVQTKIVELSNIQAKEDLFAYPEEELQKKINSIKTDNVNIENDKLVAAFLRFLKRTLGMKDTDNKVDIYILKRLEQEVAKDTMSLYPLIEQYISLQHIFKRSKELFNAFNDISDFEEFNGKNERLKSQIRGLQEQVQALAKT